MSKCSDCTKGPLGIAGHERLFSQSFGADAMRFKCKACNFVWVRHTAPSGSFSWGLPAGEHPGMDVPGRPGTAPP